MFVLVITSMFSFMQLSSPNIISANADLTNPIVTWNEFTTNLGLQRQDGPPELARDDTLVAVAIYDALLHMTTGKSSPSQAAIAAGAASEVLRYLFPDKISQINALEASETAGIQGYSKGQISSGLNIGEMEGKRVVAYAKTDGADASWDGIIPTGPCIWTGVNPIGPLVGNQKTFILNSATEFPISPPAPCGSPADQAEVQLEIDTNNNLTPEQIAIAQKWAPSPAVLDNNQLNSRILTHHLSIFDAARASAYVNVCSYDAFVAIWHIKYIYWIDRPFMRISGFVPVIPTPNFPAYPSGHSGVASSTALVLGKLFPDEASVFISEAQEDALSRLLGGVHWNEDDVNAYNLGLQIGQKVVNDMEGPPHPFVLPNIK